MTAQAISGARILANGQWLDHHAVLIERGRITSIVPADSVDATTPVEPLDGGMLLPGFIDTQVNGGGGVLFNDHPTIEGIASIAAAHRRFGTTALLPTLISDDLDVIARAIAAVDEAIASEVPGVIGIHIEGPFLNPAKHGIHNADKFRTLDDDAIELLCSLQHGKTLVTLAPECAAPGVITALAKRGVIVAAGHSLASYTDMERAVAEGLSGVTHLYNAMTQLGSREPGLVGAAIDLGLTSGLIVDGHHVHPAALRAVFRAMGAGELMLVTDAMPNLGLSVDGFALGDIWIRVEDGALRGPDGTLAGSALDMAQAVRNAVNMMHIEIATASQMASDTPAAFLGLTSDYGALEPGKRADFVHLDDAMMPQGTWIAGEQV
jgi:N-acetylglucosamine-6-phosphate deacetylase